MEATKRIELRPKQQLIDPDFNGYKLSLKPIPKLEHNLKTSPDQSSRTNEQYSLSHVQLFGMQNHLVSDPWESFSTYFVDYNWTIQNIKYNNETGELLPPKPVHELTKWDRNYGDFNITFRFVSEKYCILSNGAGEIYILNTGDRYKANQWQCVHSEYVFTEEPERKFVISNARFEIVDGKSSIFAIAISIEQMDSKFENCLDVIKITEYETNKWKTENLCQLKGKSLPDYCELEPKCKSLLICSDHKFEFTAITSNNDNMECDMNGSDNENKKNLLAAYAWCQTDEDITINVAIAKNAEKDDFKITCDGLRITVLYKNEPIMDNTLFSRVDSGLTTWQLVRFIYIISKSITNFTMLLQENESLQLNLLKTNLVTQWQTLFTGDEQDNNVQSVADIQPQRDSSAMAAVGFKPDLEDCDYEAGGTENEFVIGKVLIN